MTHYEIIIWIEKYLLGLIQNLNDKIVISYMDEDGLPLDHTSDTLIKGVLEINKKELL